MSDTPEDRPASDTEPTLPPPAPAPAPAPAAAAPLAASSPPASLPPVPPPPGHAAPPGSAAGIAGSPSTGARQVPLQPGQLTPSWQIMVAVAWTAAFFAYAAVWKTSAELGIGTWWLGPRSQPQPLLIRGVPFTLSVLVALTAVYNMRRTATISLIGSFAAAAIGYFDMSRSGGLAAIEFAIAASLFLVSIGAFAGTIRTPNAEAAAAAEAAEERTRPLRRGRDG